MIFQKKEGLQAYLAPRLDSFSGLYCSFSLSNYHYPYILASRHSPPTFRPQYPNRDIAIDHMEFCT